MGDAPGREVGFPSTGKLPQKKKPGPDLTKPASDKYPVLTRTGTKVCYDDPEKGECIGELGVLVYKGQRFVLLERLDGFKRMPPGPQEIYCKEITFSNGKKSKALCFGGKYSNGRLYIHVANYPSQIMGCMAIGLKALYNEEEDPIGVGSSQDAFDQFLDLLGGWRNHRTPWKFFIEAGK